MKGAVSPRFNEILKCQEGVDMNCSKSTHRGLGSKYDILEYDIMGMNFNNQAESNCIFYGNHLPSEIHAILAMADLNNNIPAS